MRRLLFSLLLAYSAASSTWAAKAWPFPFEIKQSDGTTLFIVNHGDEFFHYTTTTDGVVIVRQGNDYVIADISADGTITPTTLIAHEADLRNMAEKAAAEKQDKSLLTRKAEEMSVSTRATTTGKRSYTHFSTAYSQSPKVLVILAQFSDMKFHDTEDINGVSTSIGAKNIFEQYLNATGSIPSSYGSVSRNYGSVKQYFSDMSDGQFSPQFDIYGPVTLDYGYSYYGGGTNDHMDRFVPEVCKKANEAGVDFSKYDQDNDGFVDLVYIIYAGWGENYGKNTSNCIWPRSGTIDGGTYNGKRVCLYGVNNEMNGNDPTTGNATMQINGIGTFCHEFSHCLGLPDIYATKNTTAAYSANNQAMGFWDLMDLGNFVGNSYSPKAYTAFEKELMGWQKIEDLTTQPSGNYTLQPLIEGGKAYKVVNAKGNEQECIVMENIQNSKWDRSTTYLGHGMLAYHVEYDADIFNVLQNVSTNNTVNNTLGHPRMAVIPADGLMLCDKNSAVQNTAQVLSQTRGDTFSDKSQSRVTSLTDEQALPNFLFYTSDNNGKTNFALKNITENADGNITFDYVADVASGISHTHCDAIEDNRIYTLGGTPLGTDLQALPKGIYIKNHKKIVKE